MFRILSCLIILTFLFSPQTPVVQAKDNEYESMVGRYKSLKNGAPRTDVLDELGEPDKTYQDDDGNRVDEWSFFLGHRMHLAPEEGVINAMMFGGYSLLKSLMYQPGDENKTRKYVVHYSASDHVRSVLIH